jgi:hypothetical protein
LDTPRIVIIVGVISSLLTGCMSKAVSPKMGGLQRSLYPGLGTLDASQIPAAFKTRVDLHPPLTAGIVWLNDSRMWGPSLSEYARAGVLKVTTDALAKPPFSAVSPLPTTVDLERGAEGAPSIDVIRGAAAKFQYDVAFVLQTGIAEESGFNPLAIGYLGIVTAPLFPGTDVSAAAGAELCAVDVRSGVMLGCSVGRGYDEARFLFLWGLSARKADLDEAVVGEAASDAAQQLLTQISGRVSGAVDK